MRSRAQPGREGSLSAVRAEVAVDDVTLNAFREPVDALGWACARSALVAATASAMITSNASPATRILEAEKRRVISSRPNRSKFNLACPLGAGEHRTSSTGGRKQ